MSKSKWAPEVQPQKKISDDSAAAQVKELIAYYSINPDELESEDVRKAVESGLNRLSSYYARGFLENKIGTDGKLSVIQYLQGNTGTAKELSYGELSGQHKVAMDGFDPKANYQRQHALMASLAGVTDDAIKGLHGVDLSVCETLALVFLQA
jgi:hypothetical protein